MPGLHLPQLSIRWRLTLWYLLILSVVLLAFGALVYGAQASSVHSSQDSGLRQQARDLAASFDPETGRFAPKQQPDTGPASPQASKTLADARAQATLEALKRAVDSATPSTAGAAKEALSQAAQAGETAAIPDLGGSTVALLVDPGGRLVAHSGPIAQADISQLIAAVSPSGVMRTSDAYLSRSLALNGGVKTSAYRFYSTPILVKSTIFGTLILGQPDRAPAELRRLLLTLLLAAPATLLVAAAGGYWLASRALRPVRLLTTTVQEISGSDMSRRVNLGSSDELGRLADTFDQMLDRLEASFRQQRQFTSDASHELRTPLTVVQLELERALADSALPAHLGAALRTMQLENTYMSRLVNDLLLLARADAGRALLQPEVLDLSDLALAALERLAPLARQRGVELSVGALPELPVSGDRVYLAQLLGNLVENAIKYTAGHGHRVHLEAGSCDEHAWVRVSDDGPGIGADHLPHLFERFYRVDAARAQTGGEEREGQPGGSGLGLSIAQWVAQAHGGAIDVESAPGAGSAFTVRLPLATCSGGASEVGSQEAVKHIWPHEPPC